MFALFVLAASFALFACLLNAVGDTCDPLHESPNTVWGWSFSVAMVVLTPVSASRFGIRAWWLGVVALLQSCCDLEAILTAVRIDTTTPGNYIT